MYNHVGVSMGIDEYHFQGINHVVVAVVIVVGRDDGASVDDSNV